MPARAMIAMTGKGGAEGPVTVLTTPEAQSPIACSAPETRAGSHTNGHKSSLWMNYVHGSDSLLMSLALTLWKTRSVMRPEAGGIMARTMTATPQVTTSHTGP